MASEGVPIGFQPSDFGLQQKHPSDGKSILTDKKGANHGNL